jgi:hypothetical protein
MIRRLADDKPRLINPMGWITGSGSSPPQADINNELGQSQEVKVVENGEPDPGLGKNMLEEGSVEKDGKEEGKRTPEDDIA